MVPFVARLGHFFFSKTTLACVSVCLLCATPSLAQTASAKQQAAAAYDAGVQHYDRAEFEKAAESFLQADELLASDDALRNAMSAARKAHDYKKLASAAQRLLDRDTCSEDDKVKAREALAEASAHLSRVTLTCSPAPCDLFVDNTPSDPGQRYLLPGSHVFRAAAHGSKHTQQRAMTLSEGTAYDVVLDVSKAPSPTSHGSSHAKPLPPAVFYVGAGVTAILAGVTTWSGIDTLGARDDLPGEPSQGQIDDVRGKITRSNVLFGATLFTAAATGVTGWLWVDWGKQTNPETGKSGTHGVMGLRGRF